MKNRIKCLFACVFVCFAVGGCGVDRALVLQPGTDDGALAPAEETADAEAGSAETDGVVYVHVCGAVKQPRVVTLPAGSRGCDAVEAAGGFTDDAAQEALNLAELLTDGAQLFVPTREEYAADEAAAREAESGLVDINRADIAQLCTLTGIGEARAKAIIAYREANGGFQVPEDVMKVSGIKEGAFEKIKDQITVKP